MLHVLHLESKLAWSLFTSILIIDKTLNENSISDARTPQPAEIVFNIMRYSSETVQRSETFRAVSVI